MQFVSRLRGLVLACCFLVPVCLAADQGIAWRQGDLNSALQEARQANKPILLYWGAEWCPPCNQLKATLFRQPAFIEQTRRLIPVYLDGDSPGAQAEAERFHVLGYPTLLVLAPDGSELTRLSGAVDLEPYLQVIQDALAESRPTREILSHALARGNSLTPQEARILAFYPWRSDRERILDEHAAETLLTLSRQVPAESRLERARLQVAYLRELSRDTQAVKQADRGQATDILLQLLGDPVSARAQPGLLLYDLPELLVALQFEDSLRQQLLELGLRQIEGWLAEAEQEPQLGLRLLAGKARILEALAPPLPEELLAEVRQRLAAAMASELTPYSRVTTVQAGYSALRATQQDEQARTLLEAEIARQQNSYYWMLELAELSQQGGGADQALSWYRQAYQAAQGPATRIQWGSYYLKGLTELAPHEDELIEQIARELLDSIQADPNAAAGRNGKALQRIAGALRGWAVAADQLRIVEALHRRYLELCRGWYPAEPEQSACLVLWEQARKSG